MKQLILLIVLCGFCCAQTTQTTASQEGNNVFTGLNTFTLPTTFGDVIIGGVCTGCSSGGGGYATIKNASVAITQRTILNTLGALVCADNAGTLASDCKLATNAAVTNQYLTGVDASGNFLRKQIDYGELSGAPQLPVTKTSVASNWINSYDSVTGLFTATRPAYTDLTGLPQLAVTKTAVASNWLRSYDSTTGIFTASQPAYTDITGTPQLAVTKTAVASNWIRSYDSTTGLFTASQPAFTDISGVGSCAQEPALTGDVTSSGCAATLATTIPNAHTFSGNITATAGQNSLKAFSENSVLWVDGIKYTTLAGCYADIPSTGGTCMVPPNYSETLAADLTMNKNYAGFIFTGPASIVMSTFGVIVSPGTQGPFIDSWVPFGSTVLVAGTGVEFNYAGTGNAFLIGSSASDTRKMLFRNLNIFLNNAGSAAVAMKFVRISDCEVTNISIIGGPNSSVTQQGMIFDGTGNYAQCRVSGAKIESVKIGIQLTGSGVNAGNGVVIVGGSINVGATSSIGIDFEASGTGNTVWGTDIENQATALNFGASAAFNFAVVRAEGNTADITYGATACNNWVQYLSGGAGVVTDTSLCNTTQLQNKYRFDATGVMAPRVAGGIAVGSVGAPFSGYVFGTTGNQTTTLASASTTNTTATFPNNTGTVAETNLDNAFSATQTFNLQANKLGQADIVADSSGINTTETIVVKTPALAANRLVAGTHIRMTLTGTCNSSVANTSTFTVRMGTLGTTGDTAVATAVTGVAGTGAAAIPFRVVIDFTVRTTGASGTGFITLSLDSNGLTGILAAQTPAIIMPTMSTFNTTTASNILSVSYKSAATTTTSTFKQGVIEIVQN